MIHILAFLQQVTVAHPVVAPPPEAHTPSGMALAMAIGFLVVRFLEQGGGWLLGKIWKFQRSEGHSNGVISTAACAPDPQLMVLIQDSNATQREIVRVLTDISHSQERLNDRIDRMQDRILDKLDRLGTNGS